MVLGWNLRNTDQRSMSTFVENPEFKMPKTEFSGHESLSDC